VEGAMFPMTTASLSDRINVLDIGQLLTVNVYERSLFKAAAGTVTFSRLLGRYNEIVGACETVPVLRIAIKPDDK
jgi:hypothetical protein